MNAYRIKVILIDDSEIDRKIVLDEMEKSFPDIDIISVCDDPLDAMEMINDLSPDAIFLDINLESGINGLQMLRGLPKPLKFETIFITKYDEYAIEAFKLNASNYLLKPFTEENFKNAVNKMVEYVKWKKDGIRISSPEIPSTEKITLPPDPKCREKHIISLKNIIYFEAKKNDTDVILVADRITINNMSIGDPTELLINRQFARVQRSFLINIDHVKVIHKGKKSFIMSNGDEIHAGSNFDWDNTDDWLP